MGDDASLFDDHYLKTLRKDMVRFAELQLRDRHQAEDVVQEALASALSHHGQFASRSALKTWVLAILRNKVIDVYRVRTRRREQALADDDALGDRGPDIDGHFDGRGHWAEEALPADWGDPHQALVHRQFWRVMEACLTRLPEQPARVFMMREVVGLETAEICLELAITANHCAVLMYRARLALRACLGENWFAAPPVAASQGVSP